MPNAADSASTSSAISPMLLSRGSLSIFVDQPIALGFLIVCALLIVAQIGFAIRGWMIGRLSGQLS